MRGTGGPLLCIGDLLSDIGEPDADEHRRHDQAPLSLSPSSSSTSSQPLDVDPSNLTKLFQENYAELNKALAGTDHLWTSFTLKLCTVLDAANILIKMTNTNVIMLSDELRKLEEIIKRRDSSMEAVRSVQRSLSQKESPSPGSP
ncbi:hypothetical protein Dimus_025087 [Dionaea muscipula]